MEEKSLLAQFLESDVEQRREQIQQRDIAEIVQDELLAVGLYVYVCLHHINNNLCIEVASDGMPERAKDAVFEVLRAQGMEAEKWSTREGTVLVLLPIPEELLND